MGGVGKAAVKKTAERRIMAVGRACRTEAKPQAMIIRQAWLPPWLGGWGVGGVSVVGAG